jgi:hypothetical protein
MFGLFRRPPPQERQRIEGLKAVARQLLGLGEGATLSISEIQCGDVRCPGIETVILVMEQGKRTAIHKIAARLRDVDEATLTRMLRAGDRRDP